MPTVPQTPAPYHYAESERVLATLASLGATEEEAAKEGYGHGACSLIQCCQPATAPISCRRQLQARLPQLSSSTSLMRSGGLRDLSHHFWTNFGQLSVIGSLPAGQHYPISSVRSTVSRPERMGNQWVRTSRP